MSRVNAIWRKLQFQAKHPERFAVVHTRSTKTQRNLKGNPRIGNSFVVPTLGFDEVRVDRGRLLRSRSKSSPSENLIVRAREIVGPGDNIVDRIRALSPNRFRVGKGRFMVQIGDRAPFTLEQMQVGSGNQVEAAAAAIEAYKWRDGRGLEHLQHWMHLVWYERQPL